MIRNIKCIICTFCLLVLHQIGYAQIDPSTIDIVRDSFGVPHIYAPTDAAVSYGLAYAYCEDDFNSIQEVFLPAKNLMGRVKGKEGAAGDYAFALFRCMEITEERWNTLTPQFLKVAEGYVQGVNDYAAKHPKEVLHKDLFPATVKEYIASSVLALTVFNGAAESLIKIFNNKVTPAPGFNEDKGSNSIAIHGNKSTSGEAMLLVNAHQPNTGSQAFYEAHICSEEGLNVMGGLLAGGPVILHGVNEHLGWAHTVNYCDRTDLFQLRINPSNEDQYWYNGAWKDFEIKKIKLHVKGVPIAITKKLYWSVYGATMKNKQGCFSIRLGANQVIGALQQWYYMNKAENFSSFYKALQMQELSMFNIMYADNRDTIFYINNALMPVRNKNFDWKKTIPGTSDSTLWTSFRPLEQLPQYINPSSGFLFNTNHASFYATDATNNLSSKNYPVTDGWENWHNNRSKRLLELMPKDKLSFENLKQIKFDKTLPATLHYFIKPDTLFMLNEAKYTAQSAMITTLKNWDKNTDAQSKGAAIFMMLSNYFLSQSDGKFEDHILTESACVEGLKYVQEYFMKNFGTTNLTLGDVQKLVRGNKVFPLGGIRDVLSPQWNEPYKNGLLKSVGGDGYIMFIRFAKNGLPQIETVNMYGSSSHPESKHFDDQVPLYLSQKTKPMSLDKKWVYAHSERVYHPGE